MTKGIICKLSYTENNLFELFPSTSDFMAFELCDHNSPVRATTVLSI